jgi:hypothetical protein
MLAAYSLQEMANLGLEDDDDGNHTHRDNLSEDCREKHKVEGLDQYPQQVDKEYAKHDIWSTRTSHCAIEGKEQRGYKKYIDDINKCEWYKAHSTNSL